MAIWRSVAVPVNAKSCTRCPTKQKEHLLQTKGLVNSVGHNIMKTKIISFIRKSRNGGIRKMVVSIKRMMQLHREGAIGRPYQYCGQDKVSTCH